MLKTEKYLRRQFPVDAIQVTAENMGEVARWCKGEILTTDSQIARGLNKEPIKFIKVDVQNPMDERQTRAFVDDWVLFANNGFKVYTPRAFEKTFDPVFQEVPKEEAPVPSPKTVAESIPAAKVEETTVPAEKAAEPNQILHPNNVPG